jgi:hypothetical protein
MPPEFYGTTPEGLAQDVDLDITDEVPTQVEYVHVDAQKHIYIPVYAPGGGVQHLEIPRHRFSGVVKALVDGEPHVRDVDVATLD